MNSTFEIKKHSLEHVMVLAMRRLYGNDFLLGVGPVVDNGFYQDFDFLKNKIHETDFDKIEIEMRKIISEELEFHKEEISIEDAISFFEEKGEKYKVDLLNDIKLKGTSKVSGLEDQETIELTKNGKVTLYTVGEHKDLCRGPHVNNTKDLLNLAFRVDRMAGAYWRGNEKNQMLSRIYTTVFADQVILEKYYKDLEEARKRDHKILGQKLDLFVFSELVGGGLPLWTPKGTILRNTLDEYVWSLRMKYGYEKVEIPHITKKDLYITSGHWDKYKDDLFKIVTREGHEFAMKPMNCPHHTQIYARKAWSYRELPQRYANTTTCYRDEQSGELSGLSRVRAFAQDDAHVFCRISQAKDEIQNIWNIVHDFYKVFGLELKLRLSLRDMSTPEKYLGNQEHWDLAEKILKEVASENKTEYYEGIGEAAFYAPKLDFMADDSLGRIWQVATIQLDVNMPDRFDLTCVNEKGEKERIVMIHAAIMGSIERFMSIMIEHFAGAFPIWLNPVQLAIIPISNEKHLDYCKGVSLKMDSFNLRYTILDENETLGNKIRRATEQKVNLMLIIGDKEIQENAVSVRTREGKDLGKYNVNDLLSKLNENVKNKAQLIDL